MKISKTKALLLICVFGTFLVACQKEKSFQDQSVQGGNNNPGANNGSIIGDWNFLGISVQSLATVAVSAPGVEMETVTVSNYESKDNSGSIKITANEFAYSALSYSIDTVVNMKLYMNGVLLNESNEPFTMVSPALSNSTTYTKNGSDSLTLASGIFTMTDPSTGPPVATGPLGMRISWAGDTLLLRMKTSYSRSISSGGVPAILNGDFTGIIKLKKK